jgi:hypothetical protein
MQKNHNSGFQVKRQYYWSPLPKWYPAGFANARSPNGGLPNGGSPNGGLPKQYRHGGLPKWRFAKSPVPRTVLG